MRLLAKELAARKEGAVYEARPLPSGERWATIAGRLDDVIVPLPPGTAHVSHINADLFERLAGPDFVGLPARSEMTAVFEGRRIEHVNSGMEGLRHLKVWTGRIVSPTLRVPADYAGSDVIGGQVPGRTVR